MKKQIFIFILVSALLTVFLIKYGLQQRAPLAVLPNDAPTNQSAITESPSHAADSPTAKIKTGKPSSLSEKTLPPTNSEATAEMFEQLRASFDRGKAPWRTPIQFYGKVVDEKNQPVEGVGVHFIRTDLSANGTSETDTLSNYEGNFRLTNATGKLLEVWLNKNDYYVMKSNTISFDFGDGYRSSPNQPEIFHLRKKGAGVDLVTSQYGVSPVFDVPVTRDGTPIKVDFLNRKAGGDGQMELSSAKPPRGETVSEWSFRMSIPDGGFIEQNDEFPFEAPESGYQPTLNFHFKSGESNWTDRINGQYYIAFGQPRKYGRLSVETGAYIGVRLKYAINPDGSRNLEPKQ